MQNREQRHAELERMADTDVGCGQLLGIYLFKIGHLPDVMSYVRRDWIPKILDAGFPEDDSHLSKTDDT